MQDKQKVTFYLPQGIHRQLKIRAAVDDQSMSALVERAVGFYLKHPEEIEEIEASAYGKTHQVHICPECETAMVNRNGEMVSLKHQPSVITEEIPKDLQETTTDKETLSQEEALVTC